MSMCARKAEHASINQSGDLAVSRSVILALAKRLEARLLSSLGLILTLIDYRQFKLIGSQDWKIDEIKHGHRGLMLDNDTE